MAWYDSIVSGIGSLFGSNSALGGVVSSVITGYALNKVQQSISKDAEAATATTHTVVATDFGQLITLPSNQDNKIPVLYGTAYVPGIITDAVMSADRQTMTYVITLCERTGKTIGGVQSTLQFNEILWNNNKIQFDADGITALSTVDSGGNVDTNIAGLVKVYCYSNGSSESSSVDGSVAATTWAYQEVPNWNPTYSMDSLAFLVVKVKYDKTKGVIGLPNILVKLTNSLSQPGDCIYDFMTNARYGCGINPEDIYL